MEYVFKYKLEGWEWENGYMTYAYNRKEAIDRFLDEIGADLDRLESFRIRVYKI